MSGLSIIIPTLNEEEYLPKCLDLINKNASGLNQIETIVVDSGSADDTIKHLPSGVKFLSKPDYAGFKYKSLNAGSNLATFHNLLFLDADTHVPKDFDQFISLALSEKDIVGGAFELKFLERLPSLILIERLNRIRYRTQQTYFGDQGIFVKKEIFNKVEGFPPSDIMEALHFCVELKKAGKLKLIYTPIITSGRRFIQGGIIKVFMKDVNIWMRDALGLDIQPYAKPYWNRNKAI